MYELMITNVENGSILQFNNPGSPFIITEILGLDPPDATINIDEYALLDGGIYNSSKANIRTMQIAFAIDRNAAASRQQIYKVLRPGRKVRIDYSDDNGLEVFVEGYVGKPDITHFAIKQMCTVQITCPESYWRGAEAIIDNFVQITDGFHFEFASTAEPQIVFGERTVNTAITITNDGNIDVGFVATVRFKAAAESFSITNVDTGKKIVLSLTQASIVANDIIVINTRPNEKAVILQRQGEPDVSLFWTINYAATDWPMLVPGENLIKFDTDSETSPEVYISHSPLFEGV